MCEIFTLIGTAIAASVGATVGTAAAATGVLGVITAGTATAIGVGATALTVGGIAAGAMAMNNNARSAKAEAAQSKAMAQSALNTLNQAPTNVITASEKTANQLKDNSTEKRTLSSLRVPTKQQAASVGVNTSDTGTGLNIPT